MSRKSLALGASILALSLACGSYADAQQSLPTINVGGGAKRTGGKPSGNPNSGRTTAAASPASGATGGQGIGVPANTVSNLPDRYASAPPAPFQRSLPANIPAVIESKSRAEIETTVNMLTTAEAFKYMPSLYIRERYIGDQNAIIAGRVNGATESAQTMLYADGVLLSNYLGNSFAYPPRWNMVSPEEIERIDVIYGPFSALYQGNSVGGVLNIKTRMPEGRELHVRGVGAAQTFSYLGYKNTPLSGNFNVLYGDKLGDSFRYFATWNHLDSSGQPMSYAGGALQPPSGTGGTQFYGGAYKYDQNGYPALYTGAYGINHTVQDLAKVKMSYDVAEDTRVYYQSGFWTNMQNTDAWTGIADRRGVPIYNGTVGIQGPGNKWVDTTVNSNVPSHAGQQHLMNAIQIKRDSGKTFDFEGTFSQYNYLRDFQNTANAWGAIPLPATSGLPTSYSQNQTGRLTNLSGTFWRVGDVRMIYRPDFDIKGKHEVSFGTHSDLYSFNQSQQQAYWFPSNYAIGYNNFNKGKTTLQGLYVQDAWKITDNFKVIGGARGDWWNAYNGGLAQGGVNVANASRGVWPSVTAASASQVLYPQSVKGGFQPKGAFEIKVADGYEVRGSVGRAYRFPTVTELFQNLSTASSNVVNNPHLQPQVSTSYDFTQSWRWVDPFNGAVGLLNPRVSLFYEDRWNAIFQQTTRNSLNVNTTTNNNIGKARFRGVEAAVVMKDLLIDGFGYTGSVTFTDARILNNDAVFQPGTGAVIPLWNVTGNPLVGQYGGRLLNGNFYPGIPPIKMRSVFTYAPTKEWEVTAAATYNSAAWQTLSNIDTNHDTLYSISQQIQFDMKANWRFEKNWKASFGIDNIGNYKAFVFHPLSQRTFYAGVNYDFGGPEDSLQSGAMNQTGAWENQSGTVNQ
jgi:iron complex outermembrane receptor protein